MEVRLNLQFIQLFPNSDSRSVILKFPKFTFLSISVITRINLKTKKISQNIHELPHIDLKT
jgi:hypothetical protein